jgi:CheY-like chemotaxis protein
MTNLPPVLYAEDEENDAFFMQRAFIAAEILNPLYIVCDGEGVIDYLGGHKGYADRNAYPLPCLLLLDLHLLRSGLEVLAWIRTRQDFEKLSIVILTCSDDTYYTQEAYRLGANGYLVKPPNGYKIEQMARDIDRCWLKAQETPPACLKFAGTAAKSVARF